MKTNRPTRLGPFPCGSFFSLLFLTPLPVGHLLFSRLGKKKAHLKQDEEEDKTVGSIRDLESELRKMVQTGKTEKWRICSLSLSELRVRL